MCLPCGLGPELSRITGEQSACLRPLQGGPEVEIFAYRDSGNVPVYSIAFLGASVVAFLIHLPFLDRAERRRREFLTGGTAPPWYGPA